MPEPAAPPGTIFDRVGGEAYFFDLVERFYDGVETDPVLRPLYPEDLGPGKRHLALFLAQYFGGPPTYNTLRGHPRLRMRHFPFPIARAERDAWLHHMAGAVQASTAPPEVQRALLAYFEMASTSLVNRAD